MTNWAAHVVWACFQSWRRNPQWPAFSWEVRPVFSTCEWPGRWWTRLRSQAETSLVACWLVVWNHGILWLSINIPLNHYKTLVKSLSVTLIGGLEPWNFMTFHFIYEIIIPSDEHIFQRGRHTTNQKPHVCCFDSFPNSSVQVACVGMVLLNPGWGETTPILVDHRIKILYAL